MSDLSVLQHAAQAGAALAADFAAWVRPADAPPSWSTLYPKPPLLWEGDQA